MSKNVLIQRIIASILGLVLGLIIIIANPHDVIRIISIIAGAYILFNGVLILMTSNIYTSKFDKYSNVTTGIILIALGIIIMIIPTYICSIIAGIILIVIPIYRIIIAPNKIETFKKEVVRLALGLVLLFLGIGSLVQVLLYVLGGLTIACSVLYLVITLILLIKINKKEKEYQKENEVIDL